MSAASRLAIDHRESDMPQRPQNTVELEPVMDALPRAVAALANHYAPGHHITPHTHRHAQLLYATSGVMRVGTADGAWVVPPLRAVWLPAGVEHEVIVRGALTMRSVLVTGPAAATMPATARVIEVSPLLRALILAAIEDPLDGPQSPRQAHVSALLLDEIAAAGQHRLYLPMPRDTRLRRLCEGLLDRPEDAAGLDDWADRAGASTRTLARLFRAETGLSFTAWRQQARLIEAVARLAEGEPVERLAPSLGYRSPSAFTAMFRRVLGQPPTKYVGTGG